MNPSPKTEKAATLEDVLRLDEDAFIEAAYLYTLRRPPDPTGMAYYLDVLTSGFPKIHVLMLLRASREGRGLGISLPALDRAIRIYRVKRLFAWVGRFGVLRRWPVMRLGAGSLKRVSPRAREVFLELRAAADRRQGGA